MTSRTSSYLSDRLNSLSIELDSFPISDKALKNGGKISKSLSLLVKDHSLQTATKALNNISVEKGESELEWLLLARVTLVLYDNIVASLLNHAVELNSLSNFWERMLESKFKSYNYLLQTLPNRAFNYAKNSHPSIHSLFPYSQVGLSLNLRTLTFEPLNLLKFELQSHIDEIGILKDDIANSVGLLASFNGLRDGFGPDNKGNTGRSLGGDLNNWIKHIKSVLNTLTKDDQVKVNEATSFRAILDNLKTLVENVIPSHTASITRRVEVHKRPSTLTRCWPKLLIGPPVLLVIARLVLRSQDAVKAYLRDIGETARGFVQSWIVEPATHMINTIRFGGRGLGVTEAGLESDIASLERMVKDLGKENLKLSDAQLLELGNNVRKGDLSTVLQVYENEMKTPFKSALFGQLVRALLIQIQKVKCDVDTTMTKLDALLKSQELTFGFVGVAPSLAIVYFVGSWFSRFLGLIVGKKEISLKRRVELFECIRRIDFLLVPSLGSPLPEKTLGHLLLSTSIMRRCSLEIYNKRLRRGLVDDLNALEVPQGDVMDKRAIVERMWRSWGGALDWNKAVSNAR
ncbi:NCA2-domain-containing protein [Wallemia mellicola]|nr:NCA2-domain-containing protein [Wallemia mellicola]